MTDILKRLLLEDRWAPITSEMGFLELEAERTARAFAEWEGGAQADRGISVQVRSVSGPLEHALSSLLPLSTPEAQRQLFVPTRSAWTAYTGNARGGTDAASVMSYMARTLGCRGMRVVAVPHTLREDKGRFGAVMLEVYGPHQTHWLNHVRTLAASNDGGRWVFDASGTPFPFEQPERYQAKRVRDRFTFDMLREYLGHLGLSPFDEDFYLPGGAPAWLVERHGPRSPRHQDFTLAQARADF